MSSKNDRIMYFSLTTSFGGGERYISILHETLRSLKLCFFVSNVLLKDRLIKAGASEEDVILIECERRSSKLASAIKAAIFAKRNGVQKIILNGITELQFAPLFRLFRLDTTTVIHTELLTNPKFARKLIQWAGYLNTKRVILVAKHLRLSVPKFARDKITVIPNQLGSECLSTSRLLTRETLEEIIFVGRISKSKGVDDVFAAAAALPGVHFKLVGPFTEYASTLQEGIPHNVTLHGFDNDVAEHLRRADAIVFPSRSEGMPYALLEAAALGLPMIASEIAAHKEISKHIDGILLYEPGKWDALVSLIDSIRPKEIRARLSLELYESSKRFNNQIAYSERYIEALTA